MQLCSVRSMKALTFGLTLVRHGETTYNKEGLLQGQAIDSALSETGLQQAEAAGLYLKDVKFSNVFVSDMLRARQVRSFRRTTGVKYEPQRRATAEKIMQQNSSCLGLQMVCDPQLKEKSFGIAEGGRVKNFKEMARAAGESFPDFTPPEGETQEQVKERVRKFLEKMLHQIGAEHWHERSQDVTFVTKPPESSPVEGKADDGVRDIPVHALVVSHGAYMCVAVRYFVEELNCCLPQGYEKVQMFSVSPNTGMCRFILSITQEGNGFVLLGIRCVFMHRGDHVKK